MPFSRHSEHKSAGGNVPPPITFKASVLEDSKEECIQEGPKLRPPSVKQFWPTTGERMLAELFGTFVITHTLCASVAEARRKGGGDQMAVGTTGVVTAAMTYCFASISGSMFNPAVALAVILSKRGRYDWRMFSVYLLAETMGAILGSMGAFASVGTSFFFDWMQPDTSSEKNSPGILGNLWLEVVYSAILCLTVLSTDTSGDAPNQYFGVAVGFAVSGSFLARGGCDQASMNPAVTVGVNLGHHLRGGFGGASLEAWLVFGLGPFAGSCIAALLFKFTRKPKGIDASQSASTAHDVGEAVEEAVEMTPTFGPTLPTGTAPRSPSVIATEFCETESEFSIMASAPPTIFGGSARSSPPPKKPTARKQNPPAATAPANIFGNPSKQSATE